MSDDFRLLPVEMATCDVCHNECADYRQRHGMVECIVCVDIEAQAFMEENDKLLRVVEAVREYRDARVRPPDGFGNREMDRLVKGHRDMLAALAELEGEP